MRQTRREISPEDIQNQKDICARIRGILGDSGRAPLAMVDTYGCQQNESDSERLRGMLSDMGYGFTMDEDAADIVVINTCAVREHAEMRVLGNVGALTHTKRRNRNQLIALCGCMVQQEHMAEKIRRSYRHVDLVFGPHELWRFPELLERALTEKGRIFEITQSDGAIAEEISVYREGKVKAWLPVMYGCDNFCSYCVVPYVRGRERSRLPERVLEEARTLVGEGYRDITLLGQNVNSYGRDLGDAGVSFAKLLRMVCEIPGDFVVRYMTSHPKDATEELFEAMAASDKCGRHLHLPVQSGSDRILRAMNRGYTAEDYLELIGKARAIMPELVITSDIIVGFPGETDEDFDKTLELIEKVRFDALFTFLYSKREGTPASKLPDDATRAVKQVRFDRLIDAQNRISGERHAEYVGKTVRVLADGESGDTRYNLTSRTSGGRLVHLKGNSDLIGKFLDVKITDARTWALFGEITDNR